MKNKLIFCLFVLINLSVFAQKSNSVTQFGITWKFDKEYQVGQFVNGDYWVVGPVIIESVTPLASQAGENEPIRKEYTKKFTNQYGDTDLKDNDEMRNGSMVNPEWFPNQGYDSGCPSYDAALSVSFPYKMNPRESLISTISNKVIPNDMLLPFRKEKSRSALKTAAVLTCLEKAPPKDAFRPPYASTWKPIYRAEDINWDLLPNLEAVEMTPDIEYMERLVERPWLDHVSNWLTGGTAPTDNMASYGREYCRMVSLVGLRLMVEGTKEEKKKLMYSFIQIGIDLYGLRKAGAKWHMGGGITSGRKWPIVFVSILLDDKEMQQFSAKSPFHEDIETYYGKGWTGATALWQMVHHHEDAPLYEHRHPSTYTWMDKRSHGYRICCNGLAWIGEALGALLLEGKQIWNHDAFFDYCDRFMTETAEPYENVGVDSNNDLIGKAYDPFVQNMWEIYRDSVPKQPGATNNMMWEPIKKEWVDNSQR